MNSQVQIFLEGDGIPFFSPIGATITYGINRIPVAQVHMNPESLGLFCDFDSIRRKSATLKIITTNGCIFFEGVIDGINVSQQPGALVTSLVLKHKFTFLNEIYPRVLGLNAGSSNMFALNVPFTMDPGSVNPNQPSGLINTNSYLAVVQQLYGFSNNALSTNTQIIKFIVDLCKVIVNSQLESNLKVVTGIYKETIQNSLQDVLKAADINSNHMAPIVLNLLNSINVNFTKGFVLSAGSPGIADKVIGDIGFLEDTLFSAMVRMMNQYGCVFVIGNNTAFVIPEAAYLTVPKTQSTNRRLLSNQYNIALPADYESFNFNDVGENTIKGVYVVNDPIGAQNIWGAAGVDVINGSFVDPDPGLFGNIVVKTLPTIATAALSYAAYYGSIGIHQNIANQTALINAKLETDEATASIESVNAALAADVYQPVKNYMNQWAEIEYCKIKYDDRTGSIAMPFNNNWIPGAVGSVYTRQPGTYIDFYVTEVSHNFSIGAPAGGNASTNVTFKGGRPGGSNNGLDRISLYDYGYDNNIQFSAAFIKDIATL